MLPSRTKLRVGRFDVAEFEEAKNQHQALLQGMEQVLQSAYESEAESKAALCAEKSEIAALRSELASEILLGGSTCKDMPAIEEQLQCKNESDGHALSDWLCTLRSAAPKEPAVPTADVKERLEAELASVRQELVQASLDLEGMSALLESQAHHVEQTKLATSVIHELLLQQNQQLAAAGEGWTVQTSLKSFQAEGEELVWCNEALHMEIEEERIRHSRSLFQLQAELSLQQQREEEFEARLMDAEAELQRERSSHVEQLLELTSAERAQDELCKKADESFLPERRPSILRYSILAAIVIIASTVVLFAIAAFA